MLVLLVLPQVQMLMNHHLSILEEKIPIDASIFPNVNLRIDLNMPDLKDDSDAFSSEGIFNGAYDDENVGAVADFNNMDDTINVWILVDLPFGKIEIGTKWVFKNKRDERSIDVKNKARLVAQGFRQEEGIDYDKVFAPVARIEAIRLFLAFTSYMGFTVFQMDVKSAFLYGTIEKEVYVHQPSGFVDPAHLHKVYKVIKTLYGLHQAPRAWYETLSSFLMDNGFKRGTIDKTLFIKKKKSDIMLVQVYVDDIIFGSTKKSMCIEFEDCMHKRFQMSSMGELAFFLGLQVKQQPDRTFISQDKSMIGSLMYLTASRPDIMFVVCACARFQVTPKASHLNAVKRIFRYLKHQPKLGLWYPRDSPFELEAYSDSDYGGASLDRKSTTGGCQFLGRRLISWQCKKQTIVANSTTEAEYVAAANCCGQVLWIQNQMMDYGFNFMNTKIHIDNESTISVIKNPVAHSRTKHIEIRFHFIRDCYKKRLIEVIKIHTDHNVADLLTKGFDVTRFNFLVVSIGLLNLYLGFRESLERDIDGTEENLLPDMLILWLTNVSTDNAKLVPLGKDSTAIKPLEKIPPKTDGNINFHEIIDFPSRSSIHYALTVYYCQSSLQACNYLLYDTIAAQRRFLAQQRAATIRSRPPTRTQLRNQMMTYLKHVGGKKHVDLKNKNFLQKVPAEQEVTEQGTKKRKSGHVKMIARKRPRPQPDDDSDDEHRKCLRIVTFDSTIDSEIMETKSFVSKLHKVSSPDGDYLVVYRVNGHFRAFNYLMEGDLKIMMESLTEENDQGDFWNNQQDWEIVSWRLYEACRVCILELKDGTVIYMLVERRYPLSKELLQRMLDLGLEVEEESTAALHLQTAFGKDKSNPLIVDSLLKTIRLSIHLVVYNEELAIPEQTATGKGISNPLMAAPDASDLQDIPFLSSYARFLVKDLVPIPSESKDTSESDSDCHLPSCDDFSPINVYEEKSVTFSNPLFDSNDDFTFSDDESLSDEDVPEENVKTYSNPLFEFDDEYISSAVNPHFDEVLENIKNMDISKDIENGYHDSEGDITYLESLLIDDTIPNLPPEVFLDHNPRSLKDELDKEDLKSMVKVFDPEIHEKFFSLTYVKLPFEDRHYLSFTYVIRFVLPYFTYPVESPFLLSSGSEDTIFDPTFLFLVLSRWYLTGVELSCTSMFI
ncbi:putative ribonuclease H-like domain-containing protein [Tanacetum coccineum]